MHEHQETAWKAENALINLKAYDLFWKKASSEVEPILS